MIELARRAARAAGRLQLERRALQVDHKGALDLVTQVDLASEALIRDMLSAEAPGIPIQGEEGGGAEGAATRWIVDPLDGTTNFVHGLPHWCVSIALLTDGALALGVVYDPNRDELFEARRGGGAALNGATIRTSSTSSLSGSLVASGFPYDRRQRIDFYLSFVREMLLRTQGFRRAGAAALDLAWVAAGRLDGFWEFNLNPWDIAAGALLVREAGGRVTDMDGGALDLEGQRILATNGFLHDEMSAALTGLLRPPADPANSQEQTWASR
ncbi:MAG: inositol monophosphatase [Alphaproteobacteria bacterium]|nr:inositol monophosphatase [Alphaproteobacteria bacterium]